MTRSKALAYLLLGGRLRRLNAGEHYFDVTTLALLRYLRKRLPSGSRVLDMGSGSCAALGLWAWRRRNCQVTCTDSNPVVLQGTLAAVALNNAPIEVVHASLFGNIQGTFDCVVFNPPYVPTLLGEERQLPEQYRSQWDGGSAGTQTIIAFLSEFGGQTCVDRAIIGVNRGYVQRHQIEAMIGNIEGLTCEEVWEQRWPPVNVYSLVRTKLPKASTSSPLE